MKLLQRQFSPNFISSLNITVKYFQIFLRQEEWQQLENSTLGCLQLFKNTVSKIRHSNSHEASSTFSCVLLVRHRLLTFFRMLTLLAHVQFEIPTGSFSSAPSQLCFCRWLFLSPQNSTCHLPLLSWSFFHTFEVFLVFQFTWESPSLVPYVIEQANILITVYAEVFSISFFFF